MLSCVMVGDSIAVGVGQARPECQTVAKVGINSERYLTTLMPAGGMAVETAVISLGVNDDDSLDTLGNLREVRSRINGNRVFWLLPGLKDRVRDMIRTVAAENGDQLIDTRPQVGRDHLHPTRAGYEYIASETIGAGDNAEVAYAPPVAPHVRASYSLAEFDRPLSALARPADRIRRLRAMRQAEGPTRVAHVHRASQVSMRLSARNSGLMAAEPARHLGRPTLATHLVRSTPATGRTKVLASCGQGSHPCLSRPRSTHG